MSSKTNLLQLYFEGAATSTTAANSTRLTLMPVVGHNNVINVYKMNALLNLSPVAPPNNKDSNFLMFVPSNSDTCFKVESDIVDGIGKPTKIHLKASTTYNTINIK